MQKTKRKGVPPIVVSKRLGHANPSITLNTYGHLYVEMQSEAARIMDELVTPIPVGINILKKMFLQWGKINKRYEKKLHRFAPD